MSSESDSNVVDEDDEEKQIYQLIYDMYTADHREREENENALSPSSSPEHSPVHMKCYAERSLHCIDMEAVDNIQEMPVQKVNVEKPWMKTGADISDYFNYGFDEESWNTYCKKQTKLRAANTKLSVQKGNNRHAEEEFGCAYFSSASSFMLASRESGPLVDVIGGQPGSSRGVEGHSDKGNNTQVVTEMSSEEDRITSYHPTFPSNFSFLSAYSSPPPFLYCRGPPSLSPAATLDSGHVKECDDPSTSQYRFSSDVSSLGTVASSTGVTNTGKAWTDILPEKCDKDRDRSREHGHDKNSKRRRDRERWSCSSQNSAEERIRHRDTMERGHRRHSFEGDNGDSRDKSEEWQTSSHSSSSSGSSSRSRSRRDNGKDRKSQNRRSHKKTRRNAKDKETNKTFSSDNDENNT